MAITHGHGNPNWTRDETILALALYFKLNGKIPSENDFRVQELSQTLRRMPYHSDAAKVSSFRNGAGVAFKLQNLHQVATGKGLSNVSRTDREIWGEYSTREDEVANLDTAIRNAIDILEGLTSFSDGDEQFPEGRLLSFIHKRRERNLSLRGKLLDMRKSQMVCEVCHGDFLQIDEAIRQSIFEIHHVVPLSSGGGKLTKLSDLALVCANCHRLLHSQMRAQRRWISIEEMCHLMRGTQQLPEHTT